MDPYTSLELEDGVADSFKCNETRTGYHPLFLQEGAIQFVMPVQFEEGMDWLEMERFFSLKSEGSKELRSLYHKRASTHTRRPSIRQLQQVWRGERPTCMRGPTHRPKKSEPTPIRRSVSFNILPRDSELYSMFRAECMSEVTDELKVSFVDYVEVITVTPFKEYPKDIKESLWISKQERSASRRAMKEDMQRRLQRQSKKDLPVEDNLVESNTGLDSVKNLARIHWQQKTIQASMA
jgi:hypothetical protein